MSSQNFIRNVGRKIQIKFGGELVFSNKAAGTNKHGKSQFRVNVLFRQYPFRKGQSITYRGDEYTIIELAHRVRIKSKESGRSITVPYGELSKLRSL
jgi:NMD protein affecting ribosome stability and mRNA decay